ncbi:MAG: hypothetical protein GPJ54_20475 [Candidatus Heimdallarchaeota archaeon]|nr:hypothetical protein [Candidatus Heimdallarchaeota archaeon]
MIKSGFGQFLLNKDNKAKRRYHIGIEADYGKVHTPERTFGNVKEINATSGREK